MVSSLKCYILVISLFILSIHGLKVIFEASKITYTNEKYVEGIGTNVRRYNRNGNYYLNLWGRIKHTWANNVTVNIVMTEYLHNEYRRSFIEFHYKFCDLINKEPLFGAMLKQRAVVCPAPKGEWRVMNMTVQSQDFPNVWPFEKGGADIELAITETGEVMAAGYVHSSFKQAQKN